MDDNAVDADRPARAWGEDWSAVGTAVAAYADARADGRPAVSALPRTEDGLGVLDRLTGAVG